MQVLVLFTIIMSPPLLQLATSTVTRDGATDTANGSQSNRVARNVLFDGYEPLAAHYRS